MTVLAERKTGLALAKEETASLRRSVGEIYGKYFQSLLSEGEAGRLIREHVALFIADNRSRLQTVIQVGPNVELDTEAVRLIKGKHHEEGYSGWAYHGGLVLNAIERKLDRFRL